MGNKVKNVIDRVRTKQLVPIKCSVENGHILDGKAALVSGGSGDIGKAIAAELARQGCRVILSGTNREIWRRTAGRSGTLLISRWICEISLRWMPE